MGALKVQKYSDAAIDRQSGEVARLRVLKGPDQGAIFIVKASSAILGRGDEADVRISDVKASRSHARLDYTQDGWVVSDLGSANGIFFQGEYIRKFSLKSGEHFTMGDSIFEFLVSNENTRLLTAPLRSGAEVQHLDEALSAQKLRVQAYSQPVQTTAPAQINGQKKKPTTLLLVAALAGIYFFLDQSSDAPKAPTKAVEKKKEEDGNSELASYLPPGVTKDVSKTAEQYYRQGFREYREKNYMRAKSQFELALQVNPSHALARHYLLIADQEIENEIKKVIDNAQKAVVAGRLRAAKAYYESAMRLMYNDKENPNYIECEEALKTINKELERSY